MVDRPHRMFGLEPSAWALPRFLTLYGVLFLAFGVSSPFLSAFLAAKGMSSEAIGLALAAGAAVRILAGPAGGHAADLFRAPRAVFAVCAGCATFIACLYIPAGGTLPLVLVSIMLAAVLAPLVPLADALALASARADHFAYGWVRGAGSAAFILGTLVSGGVVAIQGLSSIIWLSAGLLGFATWCSTAVPDRMSHTERERPTDGIRALLRFALYRRIILAAALIQGSHALHDGFAVINWTRAGIGSATAGMLWSLSVAAEVVVFLLGRPLIDRLTPAGACALSALAGIVRWAILAQAVSVWAIAVAEPLHGFTFALQHLVSMRLIGTVVPAHLAATAQAVYGTVAIGAAYATLMLASGWLYARFGADGFWVMAGLCAAALPVAARLRPA
jgi:MFS transporter, PPP family, 3-phenylpropionic acid transporter